MKGAGSPSTRLGRAPAPTRELGAPQDVLQLAHALRTPLTSLALGVGLLDEGTLGPLNPAQREVVRSLLQGVERLSALVERALPTERLGAYAGPVERVPVDLAGVVRGASALLAPQAASRGIKLGSALARGATVVGDPTKLAWVVACLLGNALRYSSDGGAIDVAVTVSTRRREAGLTVSDQGPGLPPGRAARIFDRDGGHGLALPLVRDMVEAHGGRIEVRSEAGRGCVFRVTLPLDLRWGRKRPQTQASNDASRRATGRGGGPEGEEDG